VKRIGPKATLVKTVGACYLDGGWAPTWNGGCIEYAVLKMNSYFSWYTGTGTPPANHSDLWSMLTHELGHVISLGDLSGSTPETMRGSMPAQQTEKRTLHSGDIAGYDYRF
jgi:hypothetical protein